jgi:hypothetical protein
LASSLPAQVIRFVWQAEKFPSFLTKAGVNLRSLKKAVPDISFGGVWQAYANDEVNQLPPRARPDSEQVSYPMIAEYC